MLSLHNLGIGLKSHSIVLDLSVAQCSDIHYMSRNSLLLLSSRINVQLILTIIILWAQYLISLIFRLEHISITFSFWTCISLSYSLLQLNSLQFFSPSAFPHLDLVVFDAPLRGILNMLDGLVISLQLEATQS